MTAPTSTLVRELTTRPVSLEVAPPANLPVPVFPAPSARVLFATADRLVDGMHEAARGKGRYTGRSWQETVKNASIVWGSGLTLGAATAAAHVFGWEYPWPFLLGLIGGVAATVACDLGLREWASRARASSIPLSEAEPYVAAFKSGDPQLQALARQLASSALDAMSAHGLTGNDFQRQLVELAAVSVALRPDAARRVAMISELARALPRRDREEVSCLAIEGALERLEPEDRRELAPQLLSYLFRGERLRWKLLDPSAAPRLRAALTGVKLLASREELQKLVAPDTGGSV